MRLNVKSVTWKWSQRRPQTEVLCIDKNSQKSIFQCNCFAFSQGWSSLLFTFLAWTPYKISDEGFFSTWSCYGCRRSETRGWTGRWRSCRRSSCAPERRTPGYRPAPWTQWPRHPPRSATPIWNEWAIYGIYLSVKRTFCTHVALHTLHPQTKTN